METLSRPILLDRIDVDLALPLARQQNQASDLLAVGEQRDNGATRLGCLSSETRVRKAEKN
jgi:hypothetical protein